MNTIIVRCGICEQPTLTREATKDGDEYICRDCVLNGRYALRVEARRRREESEYSDAQRIDEMSCVDDYNRFEEQCIFEDREWEDY